MRMTITTKVKGTRGEISRAKRRTKEMNQGKGGGVSNSVYVKGSAGVWTSFLGNNVIMLGDD